MDIRFCLEPIDLDQAQPLAISPSPCLVGRDAGCDLRIDFDRVSRHHARLTVHDDGIEVEDLDSTNGTFVELRRIDRPTRLKPGQRLHLADHAFVLRRAEGQGATLVPAGRSGDPGQADTMVGYTAETGGFPLLAPAFYELLNQCLIEIEHASIATPTGLPHAELLRCRSRHRSLLADSAELMDIGRELGEEARLGALLRNEAVQAADAADLGPRLLIEQHTAESDAPVWVFDELDRIAAEYPHLELVALLIGPTTELLDWLKAFSKRGRAGFRLALEPADVALADHLPLPTVPDYLFVEAAGLGNQADDDRQRLITWLKDAGTRIVAIGGDSGESPPEAADLICTS